LGPTPFRRFLARQSEPGRGTLKRPIDGRLDDPDPIESVAHSLRPLPCFDPNAAHLRFDLAKATVTDATARAVAQILRAIHGAGHAGRRKHALAAHTTVEEETLDQPLGHRRRSLQSLIADHFEKGYEPNHGAFEHSVYAFEEARMANGKETNRVHSDADLLFEFKLPHATQAQVKPFPRFRPERILQLSNTGIALIAVRGHGHISVAPLLTDRHSERHSGPCFSVDLDP
jgi:hypothetical protein